MYFNLVSVALVACLQGSLSHPPTWLAPRLCARIWRVAIERAGASEVDPDVHCPEADDLRLVVLFTTSRASTLTKHLLSHGQANSFSSAQTGLSVNRSQLYETTCLVPGSPCAPAITITSKSTAKTFRFRPFVEGADT